MKDNSLKKVGVLGQSICLDYIRRQLPNLRISIDHLTQQLENEGVEKFSISFDKLMKALEKAVQK